MGYLDGFLVTVRQIGRKQRVTTQYPQEKRPKRAATPRPSRPQPLRGRHGEVHRLRAVRRRVPGAVHLRARRRQPDRRPGVARRALRVRLRDQLPALHPLRPLRRGLPDRGHHRDQAVRVLVHQPRRTPSTPRTSSLVDDDGQPRHLPWEDWRPGEDDCTPRPGCGPPPRRASPRSRAGWPGPASSATASASPRPTRPPRTPMSDPHRGGRHKMAAWPTIDQAGARPRLGATEAH